MAVRLCLLYSQTAEVVHVVRLKRAVACVLQLVLAPHIVREITQLKTYRHP